MSPEILNLTRPSAPGLALWLATFITAKVLTEALWDVIVLGKSNFVTVSFRRDLPQIIAYPIGLALVLYTIHGNLGAVLPIAVMFRGAQMAARRLLTIPNHCFLEFLLLIGAWSLLSAPATLLVFLQLATASVWVLSAVHKIHDGEVLGGAFFYFNQRQVSGMPDLQHASWWGPLDATAMNLAKRMGLVIVATELVVPILGLLLSGSVFGVTAMLGMAAVVALVSREYNFMLTNIALACTFAVPLDLGALRHLTFGGYVLGAWLMIWPLAHAVLARKLSFSSWRLFGWGMYSTVLPRIYAISPQGELQLPVPSAEKWEAFMATQEFGRCKIDAIRHYVHKRFFQQVYTKPAIGIVMQWHRLKGTQRISEFVILRRGNDEKQTTMFVEDGLSEDALKQACRALSTDSAMRG